MKSNGLAVVWNMDGVIVDSVPLQYQALQMVFKKHGLTSIQGIENKPSGLLDTIKKYLGPDATDVELFTILQEQEALYRSIISDKTLRPRPGAVALLKDLGQHGFRQALISAAPLGNVSLIVTRLGLESYFSEVICAEQVAQAKPHPQIFILAAARLKANIHECLLIEDMPAGVEAAKKIGMHCIGVTTNHARERLSMADKVVDSLEKVSVRDILCILNYESESK